MLYDKVLPDIGLANQAGRLGWRNG